MIEDDIGKLDMWEPLPALDGLEAGIWAGVLARQETTRISRVVVACQAAVVAFGLIGSIAVGERLGYSTATPSANLSVSTSGLELAPSTLLLGRHI